MTTTNPIIGNQVLKLQSLASTNEFLQKEIKNGANLAEGFVVVARNQYEGKGLDKNKWESAPGMNLILSAYLKPNFIAAQDQFLLNKLVSLSVLDFINSISAKTSNKIKWPNDIYINDQKVSGILINNTIGGSEIMYSVIGVGININQVAFESDAPNPVSLKQIQNLDLNLDKCLNSFLIFFNRRYMQLRNREIQKIDEDYLKSLYRINEQHLFDHQNQTIKARVIGLGEFGKLKLVTEDNVTIECDMKEIKFTI